MKIKVHAQSTEIGTLGCTNQNTTTTTLNLQSVGDKPITFILRRYYKLKNREINNTLHKSRLS